MKETQYIGHEEWCRDVKCRGGCNTMARRIKKAARNQWDATADDVLRASCECMGTTDYGSKCCCSVEMSQNDVIEIVSDQMCDGAPYGNDQEACEFFYNILSLDQRRELLRTEFTYSSYGY